MSVYPWDYVKELDYKSMYELITAEENKEREARQWQEWLVVALSYSMKGLEVPSYESFKMPIKKKKEIPDTVFDDIRKKFNLGG